MESYRPPTVDRGWGAQQAGRKHLRGIALGNRPRRGDLLHRLARLGCDDGLAGDDSFGVSAWPNYSVDRRSRPPYERRSRGVVGGTSEIASDSFSSLPTRSESERRDVEDPERRSKSSLLARNDDGVAEVRRWVLSDCPTALGEFPETLRVCVEERQNSSATSALLMSHSPDLGVPGL